jgi:hypothetical protein
MAERDSLGDLVARIDQRTVAIDALVIRLLTRVDHIEESNTRIGDQVARLGDLVARFCAQVNRIGDQVARFDNRINLVIAILNAIEAQVSPPIGGADAVLEEEEEEEDDVPVHAAAGVRPQNLDLNAQHVDLAILSIGGADAGLEEEEEDDVPVHAADAGLEEEGYVPVHAAAGVRIPQNLDLNAQRVDPAILFFMGAGGYL